MDLMKNSLNKKRIFIAVLIVGLGLAPFYWIWKYLDTTSKLKNQKQDYQQKSEQLEKRSLELSALRDNNNKLQADYAALQKDYKQVSLDRDNVLVQAKLLLGQKARADGLQESLDNTKKDMDLLRQEKQLAQKDRQDALDQNQNLKKQLIGLEKQLQENFQERSRLQELITREKDKSVLNKIEKDNARLGKENTNLSEQLKKRELEMLQSRQDKEREAGQLKEELSKTKEQLSDSVKKAVQLQAAIEGLNKDYAEAVRKNAIFQRKVTESPKRFTELARQNQALIKETANMHYNLGVFYLKTKEYTRAIAELEKAVELNPDDAYAHFNLGYIYAEYMVNREMAIGHFRHYLRLAKKEDKDVDWAKKYILTWQSWSGKEPMK